MEQQIIIEEQKFTRRHINRKRPVKYYIYMMNCPNCGAIMVWLNGSVLHDHPVKQYECRTCQIFAVKYPDGNYETIPVEADKQQQQ
jgi:hypothetical protein